MLDAATYDSRDPDRVKRARSVRAALVTDQRGSSPLERRARFSA